jgi:hypothetical protein
MNSINKKRRLIIAGFKRVKRWAAYGAVASALFMPGNRFVKTVTGVLESAVKELKELTGADNAAE